MSGTLFLAATRCARLAALALLRVYDWRMPIPAPSPGARAVVTASQNIGALATESEPHAGTT